MNTMYLKLKSEAQAYQKIRRYWKEEKIKAQKERGKTISLLNRQVKETLVGWDGKSKPYYSYEPMSEKLEYDYRSKIRECERKIGKYQTLLYDFKVEIPEPEPEQKRKYADIWFDFVLGLIKGN